jgi:hypothetical protein
MDKSIRIFVLVLGIVLFSCVFPFRSFAFYDELIGKEVVLKSFENSGIIYAGIDEKSFQMATGNLMGKNKPGYLMGILSNRVFEVHQGTRARLLSLDFTAQAAQVLISEGTFKGQTCWVVMEQAIGY